MFLRILVALFTVMILSLFTFFKPMTFTDSTKDINNIRLMEMLDVKIVEYYLNNVDSDTINIATSSNGIDRVDVASGILPESLDSKTLGFMGINDLDPSIFSYEKLADNKFNLTYTKITDGTKVVSKNSGKNLNKVQVIVW